MAEGLKFPDIDIMEFEQKSIKCREENYMSRFQVKKQILSNFKITRDSVS